MRTSCPLLGNGPRRAASVMCRADCGRDRVVWGRGAGEWRVVRSERSEDAGCGAEYAPAWRLTRRSWAGPRVVERGGRVGVAGRAPILVDRRGRSRVATREGRGADVSRVPRRAAWYPRVAGQFPRGRCAAPQNRVPGRHARASWLRLLVPRRGVMLGGRGRNSVGRMPASQAGRRRFEPGRPLFVSRCGTERFARQNDEAGRDERSGLRAGISVVSRRRSE